MVRKRIYQKPTIEVVEMKTSGILLENSAKLGGYKYEDGWED